MSDLTTMTDTDLDQLREDVAAEVKRRADLKSVCGLITGVVSEAVKVGVGQHTIDAAVAEGLTPE